MPKQSFSHDAIRDSYVWAKTLREYNDWYKHCRAASIPFVHVHQQGRYCTIYGDGITVSERYWTWNSGQRDQYTSLIHKALKIEPSSATRTSVESGVPSPGQVVQKEFILSVSGVLTKEAHEIATGLFAIMQNVTRFTKRT